MAKRSVGRKHPKRQRPRCRGLQRKIRFPTERIANKALNAMWRSAINGNYRGEKMPCRCYGPCTVCRGWHLTSQSIKEYGEV